MENFYTKDGILFNILTNLEIAHYVDKDGYKASRSTDGKQFRHHRIIFKIVNGYLPDTVDHKDGNTLNNHPDNLREATQSENLRNCKKREGSSKYKGIYWNSKERKWVAQIRIDGKNKRIGTSSDELVAYEIWCKYAKEHYGDFARLA